MKALVTGGAGFIGSHVTEALIDDGVEVVVLDDLSIGLLENIPEAATFREGSILDGDLVAKLMSDVDVVYHMACVSLPVSLGNPTLSHEVNANGALVMLEAARKADLKFVHISSSEVYGTTVREAMDEEHPLRPRTPYAASKLAGESLAHSYWATYELPVVIIRPFNAFGPRHQIPAVIPTFIERMLTGKSPTIYGNGKYSRDFTFVEDLARGITHLSTNAELGSITNLGSGVERSVTDLFTVIKSELGSDIEPVYVDGRAGDVERMRADASIANSLGWKPEHSFDAGIGKTIDFWKNKIS